MSADIKAVFNGRVGLAGCAKHEFGCDLVRDRGRREPRFVVAVIDQIKVSR